MGSVSNIATKSRTQKDSRIAIVIPAYNEARTVGDIVRNLRSRFPWVVAVDDGSADTTAAEASVAGAIVIRHLINRGQGAALKTGIDYALSQGADVVVTFDSDGQHQAEDIEELVAPILAGEVDVVLGSRFLRADNQVPPLRKLMLKLAVVFTRMVSRIRISDTHNGLRALSRAAATQIEIRQDRMAHASEILDEIGRLRLRYREVPVQVLYTEYSRQKGQSGWAAFRIVTEFLLGKWRR